MAFATIALDLLMPNVGFNSAVDPALLEHKPELVRWLEQQPGHWRLTSYNPHGDNPFHANSGWLFDLQDVRGYDSIIPKQYTQFMGTIEPQNELPFNRVQPVTNWESLNSPLLDVLGVKYIVTSENIDLPKLQLAWEGEGLRVYENLVVAPRAYSLSLASTAVVNNALEALTQLDPRHHVVVEGADLEPGIAELVVNQASSVADLLQPAPVNTYGNLEVTVSAEVPKPSWLILNDSYSPGWKAFVSPSDKDNSEEREVPIVRVNGNFRGVLLEPGSWNVRFRYSPRSFQLGGLTSFMAGIILMFAVGTWGWRRLVDPKAQLTSTRSIAKNSFVPVVLNLLNRAIDFVFAAYYLRVLGPSDAGSYATAIAAAGIFEIVSNYGLDILIVREVSQDRGRASRYLLNTSIMRFGAAFVASLPIVAFIMGTELSNNPMSGAEISAIALIMVGMVFSGVSKGVDRLFYVYERAEIPAAMTTVTTILKVGFGVIALLFGFGFVGLAAVSILTNIITMIILGTLAFRSFELPGPWRVDWQLQRQMIRLGFPLMLIHLLQTVFISIDVFLLRFMLVNGEEVVGWYNSAYKWFNALQIVPSFFTLALFPVISREIKNAPETARRMYRMALKLMLMLALPIAAVTSFLAFPLVTVLAGNEFLPHGAIALQIVIWSIPIGWLNSVTNYMLIGLGLERKQPRAFTLAVGFNIVANAIFIPTYGYVAASVTTILSEVVLLFAFDYYLRKRMPDMNWFRFAWRPVLVTVVMVVVMFLGQQAHTAIGLALGLITYPFGLWTLRVIGEEERHILRSLLPAPIADRLGLG
jgi:O-antigen/teichoic acid export membrane protein